mmetsp:Transcript_20542/g.18179  ORF Transcript_20542/g.18179 Transcript_20542/m.18179 type:complete len:136 (+) Transcript_20542:1231-1638(+)
MGERYKQVKNIKEVENMRVKRIEETNKKLDKELDEAMQVKERLENELEDENNMIYDLESKIKEVLDEIGNQKATLNEQKRHMSSAEAISEKAPFLAKYIIGQEQLISKQKDVNNMKINVFSQLLDYCEDFIQDKN